MAEQNDVRRAFAEANPVGVWMCEVESDGAKVRVIVIATNALRARVAARCSDRAEELLGVSVKERVCHEAIFLGPVSNISDGQGVSRNRELREWFREVGA